MINLFVPHAHGGVLQSLELHRSPFPSLALPVLTALPSLKEFTFDMSACVMSYLRDWTDERSAASALLIFALGTPSLETVTVRNSDTHLGAVSYSGRVQQMLAARGSTVTIDLR
jgi:hypothetical protein